ncbi:MAG TPA: CopG family transcriptional regulator [Thermoanaerobaculia bacterium]|nr:CopG family transcriptional regulator [Thermoanaerobaculia bacterium]
MKKTTIYLPDDLKKKVEGMAKQDKKSEADVIRDAVFTAYQEKRTYPKPRLPLVPGLKLGRPDVAEKVDELLDGFGE